MRKYALCPLPSSPGGERCRATSTFLATPRAPSIWAPLTLHAESCGLSAPVLEHATSLAPASEACTLSAAISVPCTQRVPDVASRLGREVPLESVLRSLTDKTGDRARLVIASPGKAGDRRPVDGTSGLCTGGGLHGFWCEGGACLC